MDAQDLPLFSSLHAAKLKHSWVHLSRFSGCSPGVACDQSWFFHLHHQGMAHLHFQITLFAVEHLPRIIATFDWVSLIIHHSHTLKLFHHVHLRKLSIVQAELAQGSIFSTSSSLVNDEPVDVQLHAENFCICSCITNDLVFYTEKRSTTTLHVTKCLVATQKFCAQLLFTIRIDGYVYTSTRDSSNAEKLHRQEQDKHLMET